MATSVLLADSVGPVYVVTSTPASCHFRTAVPRPSRNVMTNVGRVPAVRRSVSAMASSMLEHGVRGIRTADVDFHQPKSLRGANPVA